jgi:2-keto-3-deoxy-L-arabinonate dehydratase
MADSRAGSPVGLIPILATPFTSTGTLDRVGFERLVDFEVDCGVDGLAVFGMASEGFALTADDRRALLAILAERVPTGLPIVAGVNATSTETAVEQALLARDLGATVLMVLPPFLAKPAPAEVVDFYARLAERVAVPLMVQDAPATTGVSLPTGLLAELSALPGVESVKVEAQPTAPKVAAVAAAAPGWAVLGGQNALFVLEEYAGGAVGTMPACEFSDELAAVLRCLPDDPLTAHRRFNALLPLIRFGLQPGIAHAVHKEVLVRRGVIDCAKVRNPVSALDRHSLAALELILSMTALPRWEHAPVRAH